MMTLDPPPPPPSAVSVSEEERVFDFAFACAVSIEDKPHQQQVVLEKENQLDSTVVRIMSHLPMVLEQAAML